MRLSSLGAFSIVALSAACLVRSPPRAEVPRSVPDAGIGPAPSVAISAADASTPLASQAVDAGGPLPLTMVIGGDVTLGFHYEEYVDDQIAKGKTRDEMLGYGFDRIRPALDGGDLFVVNLECPFTARGDKIEKNFNFRARPELVATLLNAGVGAVSLANNHMMDYGPVGLADTLATLDTAKIPHFGAGRTLAEARQPAIVTVKGVRIAFLGYFFLGDHNIEPPEVIATESTPGVAGHHDNADVMEKMLREDIALARPRADLVIPFFHWGKEGEHEPQPYQQRLAHAAIEAGAAAVFGSHPHVLQGMELFHGGPVLYSMGNFVFGGNWNPRVKESAIVRLRMSSAGYLGSEIIPIQTDLYPERPAQPFLLEGDAGTVVLQHLAEYSKAFAQPLPGLPGNPP